jgi:hypothetical protein
MAGGKLGRIVVGDAKSLAQFGRTATVGRYAWP